MNSVIEKYFTRKRNELVEYSNELLTMFSYSKNITIDNETQALKKIFQIYINKFFKSLKNDFSLLNKYYTITPETDVSYRMALDSTIEYFETNDLNIQNNNETLLYLSYIVYFSILIDKFSSSINMIDDKESYITLIANKISSSFVRNEKDMFKKGMHGLLSLIKQNIRYSERVLLSLNRLDNKEEYNEYICLNNEANLYQIKYNYVIDDLKKYKEHDVLNVYNKENINGTNILSSYELSQITLLKGLLNNKKIYLALELNEEFCKKKMNINNLIKLMPNNYLKESTKILVKGSVFKKLENIEVFNELGIKIIIDSTKKEEIDSIMFNDNMILMTSNNYLFGYKTDLESKKIKYIRKTDSTIFSERELLFGKETMEVKYE